MASNRLRIIVSCIVATLCKSMTTTPTKVLVVGGSGRVGGSTVRWLRRLSDRDPLLNLAVSSGGRSSDSFRRAVRRGVLPPDTDFVPVDLDGGDESLSAAVGGFSLVVHTAGPFQGRTDPGLLRSCVRGGVAYVDVCDEWELAVAAKEMEGEAAEAGVAAVVSSGIWPGVSALMAAEAIGRLRNSGKEVEDLKFSFFTSGTGNAGPTIVSATFLLLATPALTYADGKTTQKEPWTEQRSVDFGPTIGTKPTWLLDNPDVPTVRQALGVPNVSSRFGTDPLFWNYLFGAMKAIPRSLLYNRDAMQNFALFSEPIIRAVDALVGATNAMRVDVTAEGGETVTMRMAHPDLEQCVGQATAAFALEVLRGTVAPGVWFPAELQKEARANILEAAREDSIVYEL